MPTLRESTEPVVRGAFAFLEDRGIPLVTVMEGDREVTYRFESNAVRVLVTVEYGADPSVWIVDSARGETHALLFIVEDTRPELAPLVTGENGDRGVDARLADLARALRGAGSDVLAGDFSGAPRFRALAAVWRREDNRARFGSVTGEHPRFTERPTLEALFAGADNEGLVDARTYQAVWDWQIPLDEIAAFLGCSADDVQARLNRWDGTGR